MTQWFETERLWEVSYDFLFSKKRFEQTENEVDQLLALVGAPVRDALDLCCGPGRASIVLARRGVQVTGVDRSRFMLDKARAGAIEANVDVEFIEDDMRRFVRADSYDLVLSLFTSFGYFESQADNLRVLENARRSLRTGGAFVLQMMNKELLAQMLHPAAVMTLPDGRVFFEHRRVLDGWERVVNDWYFLDSGRYEHFTLRHFLYSGVELRTLLLSVGFSSVELYGGFGKEPFVGPARLHAVARV